MKAMVWRGSGSRLKLEEVADPVPAPHEVVLDVAACGICRTDLHVFDSELDEPTLPLVLGHQVVGRVVALGSSVTEWEIGDRVGVAWLGGCCEECRFCVSGRENLCDEIRFTGYQRDGGFAERCCADARFCLRIPASYDDEQAAPLLCAGLIGYRAFEMAGRAERLGLYGFGAAAHILLQVAKARGIAVSVFTRPGDIPAQALARKLGADWVGNSGSAPSQPLDAAILFAPVGELVPVALRAVDKGGTVVCAGIHMSDIPSFAYSLLWGERSIRSVANLTREDGRRFFSVATEIPIRTQVSAYPLERANEALDDLREGRFAGAAVLRISR